MKMTTNGKRVLLVVACWALLLAVLLGVGYATRRTTKALHYAEMEAATQTTKRAFDALYAEKLARGIAMDGSDLTHSGVIGTEKLSAITTTDGSLRAKQASTNPNFAALFVRYLSDAGVRIGDEVGLMFSSSFPGLNIACLAACESMGVNVCLMNSVGASVYGATDADFTFMDMLKVLQDQGILHTSIDYLSFGGEGDVGSDYHDEDDFWVSGTRTAEEIRTLIRKRAEADGITFIYEPGYAENVSTRISLLQQKVPNMKLFISVGGSTVSIGRGLGAYIDTGYCQPATFAFNRMTIWDRCPEEYGLLNYFHAVGIPVVSMLNIESLAINQHMDIIKETAYPLGVGDMYEDMRVAAAFPIVALVVSVVAVGLLIPLTHKAKSETKRFGKLFVQQYAERKRI